MEYLGALFMQIIGFLQREFTLYGYTFSYWGVIIFLAIAAIVGSFIWSMVFE